MARNHGLITLIQCNDLFLGQPYGIRINHLPFGTSVTIGSMAVESLSE